MKPKEVIKKLEALGIKTTDRTLRQYAKDGLIAKPDTKGAGRGAGKVADYPEDSHFQFYASYVMRNMQKVKSDMIRAAREAAVSNEPGELFKDALNGNKESEAALRWLTERDKLQKGFSPDDDVRMRFDMATHDARLVKKKPPQTAEEMLKIAEAITKALGGEVGRKK